MDILLMMWFVIDMVLLPAIVVSYYIVVPNFFAISSILLRLCSAVICLAFGASVCSLSHAKGNSLCAVSFCFTCGCIVIVANRRVRSQLSLYSASRVSCHALQTSSNSSGVHLQKSSYDMRTRPSAMPNNSVILKGFFFAL